MGTPPRCGQTNKVKLLPSRRTTYAGGNYTKSYSYYWMRRLYFIWRSVSQSNVFISIPVFKVVASLSIIYNHIINRQWMGLNACNYHTNQHRQVLHDICFWNCCTLCSRDLPYEFTVSYSCVLRGFPDKSTPSLDCRNTQYLNTNAKYCKTALCTILLFEAILDSVWRRLWGA